MSGTLKDLSAAAIKANLFEWWRYAGSSPRAEFYDSPELTWLLTGIPNPFVNSVLRTQVGPDNIDAIIERTLAHFRSRGVTTFSWWAEPGTQPADLGVHLVNHGLTHTDGTPGMAVDLLELNEDLPTPAGLTIEPVMDARALKK